MSNEIKTPTEQDQPAPIRSKEWLGDAARVEAVKGYMSDRMSLIGALEKLSSYYTTHATNREWLVAEIVRVDEAVASLLSSNAALNGVKGNL